jgi:hypothetical protein
VWVGLGVAVVRRDGFDVVAGIAIQIFVVAFVFANDASISCDFSRDYFVGVCDGDAKLAFFVALYAESKDTLSEILLLLDSFLVSLLLEKFKLEVSEFLFRHEGSPC